MKERFYDERMNIHVRNTGDLGQSGLLLS